MYWLDNLEQQIRDDPDQLSQGNLGNAAGSAITGNPRSDQNTFYGDQRPEDGNWEYTGTTTFESGNPNSGVRTYEVGTWKRSQAAPPAASNPPPAASGPPAAPPPATAPASSASEQEALNRSTIYLRNATPAYDNNLTGTDAAAKFGTEAFEYSSRFGDYLGKKAALNSAEANNVSKYHLSRYNGTPPQDPDVGELYGRYSRDFA